MNKNSTPLTYNGFKVFIVKPRLVKNEVPRTWRERLTTRPWRPFKKTKTVDSYVNLMEKDEVVMKGDHLHMTAETWEQIKQLPLGGT